MTYSLSELTKRMSGKSVTLGWDAVMFMNRAKVNRLLEQQYITRFNRDSFMKRITGVAPMTPDGEEVVELSGLILSQPRLSFEAASLRDSRVTATMDIVSGTVSYVRQGSLQSPSSVVYSYIVSAHQGHTVTMDIDLAASQGTVNEQGRVILDIGDGYNCRCNLVNESKAQEKLGDFFKTLFMEQKPEDRVYELGMLDLRDVDLLAPRSFKIRTMATEQGKIRSSDDYGEGAVVLMVRTKGNPNEGDDPAEGAFDYLIPNDVDANTGKAKYSGALVLASRVMFDWYIQYPIEAMVGNGITFERVFESNYVARSLKAVSGDLLLPAYYHQWHDSAVLTEKVSTIGRHKIPFYNPVTDNALRILPTEDAALSISWNPDVQKQPFQVDIWHFPFGHTYYDSDGEVTADVNIVFDPVVDPSDNSLLFKTRTLKANFSQDYQPVVESYRNLEFSRGMYDVCIPAVINKLNEYKLFFQDAAKFKNFGIPEINTLAISNLLFPERNALHLTDARLPGDLLMVGHIDPKETTFTLEPLLPVIKAGNSISFDIKQLNLKAAEVSWSVRSVDGVRALGTIDNGTYTAPSIQLLDGSASRNVVTATYTDPATGKEVTASALVTVVMAGVVVTPAITVIDMDARKSVNLKASTLGTGSLKWTPRDDVGSLVADGTDAVYTPPSTSLPDGTLQAVLFDVEDTVTGEKAIGTVILRQGHYALDMSPPLHPGLRPASSALLKVAGDHAPTVFKWEVVVGEGQVDPETGIFTAPEEISLPYSVVKVSVEDDFFNHQGYCVIHLSEHAKQSNWYQLDVFEFEVTMPSPTVYANGLQQARVVVRVRPTDVNNNEVMLSDTEMASICLVTADQKIPLPEVGIGGVPKGDKWHCTEVADDRFDPYPHPGFVASEVEQGHSLKTVQLKEFFVQCHKVEDLRIAAMLLSDSYRPFYTNTQTGDDENTKKVIKLVAKEPPLGGTVGGVAFTFDNSSSEPWPIRVEGGANEVDLSSLDYYYLKLKILEVVKPIRSVEFVGNTSMVQWESNTTLEDVHSITGWAMADYRNENGDMIMHFDNILLRRIAGQTQHPELIVKNSDSPPAGQVLFCLQRREYWTFDRYMKSDFNRALDLVVIDNYGNNHQLKIGFDGTNRNKLRIIG